MCLEDAEMMECVNGHTFCCDEALKPAKEELIKIILENEWNKSVWDSDTYECRDFTEGELFTIHEDDLRSDFCVKNDGYYNAPECICPICQFKEYSKGDMIEYLLKEYNLNPSEILKSWKEKFGTYKKFKEWLE